MRRDDGNKMKFVEYDLPPLDPEVIRKAQLTVCDNAQDVTLARSILEVLGLDT